MSLINRIIFNKFLFIVLALQFFSTSFATNTFNIFDDNIILCDDKLDKGGKQFLLAKLLNENPTTDIKNYFLRKLNKYYSRLKEKTAQQADISRLYSLYEINTDKDVNDFINNTWSEIKKQIDWYSIADNIEYFNLNVMHRILYDIALLADFIFKNPPKFPDATESVIKNYRHRVHHYFTFKLNKVVLTEKEQVHVFLEENYSGEDVDLLKKNVQKIIPIITKDGFVGINTFLKAMFQGYFIVGYGEIPLPGHGGSLGTIIDSIEHDYVHALIMMIYGMSIDDEVFIYFRKIYASIIKKYFKSYGKSDDEDKDKFSRTLRSMILVFIILHELPTKNLNYYCFHDNFKEKLKTFFSFKEENLVDENLIENQNEMIEEMFSAADMISLLQSFDPERYKLIEAKGYQACGGVVTINGVTPTRRQLAEIKQILILGLCDWWSEFWQDYSHHFFKLPKISGWDSLMTDLLNALKGIKKDN